MHTAWQGRLQRGRFPQSLPRRSRSSQGIILQKSRRWLPAEDAGTPIERGAQPGNDGTPLAPPTPARINCCGRGWAGAKEPHGCWWVPLGPKWFNELVREQSTQLICYPQNLQTQEGRGARTHTAVLHPSKFSNAHSYFENFQISTQTHTAV